MTNTLAHVLRTTVLRDLFQDLKTTVSVGIDAPVRVLLDTLHENRIHSVPVLVRPDGDPHRASASKVPPPVAAIVGFVDASDILDALLQALPTGDVSEETMTEAAAFLLDKPVSLLFDSFSNARVAVAGRQNTCRDWALKGHLETTVMELFQHVLAQSDSRRAVHRVGVFDAAGTTPVSNGTNGDSAAGEPHLLGVLSQSDLVRLVASQAALLGALGASSLQQLGFAGGARLVCEAGPAPSSAARAPQGAAVQHPARPHVLCVSQDVCTLQALRAMVHHNVSALGVVRCSARQHGHHASGVLVGVLSAEHVLDLLPHGVRRLHLPLRECLKTSSQTEEAASSWAGADVRCSKHTTFADAVANMAVACAQRIWVVDEEQCLCGLLTATDVLSLVRDTCAVPV